MWIAAHAQPTPQSEAVYVSHCLSSTHSESRRVVKIKNIGEAIRRARGRGDATPHRINVGHESPQGREPVRRGGATRRHSQPETTRPKNFSADVHTSDSTGDSTVPDLEARFKSDPEPTKSAPSDIVWECPSDCSGCTCFRSAPCSHCVDHGRLESDMGPVPVDVTDAFLMSADDLYDAARYATTGIGALLSKKEKGGFPKMKTKDSKKSVSLELDALDSLVEDPAGLIELVEMMSERERLEGAAKKRAGIGKRSGSFAMSVDDALKEKMDDDIKKVVKAKAEAEASYLEELAKKVMVGSPMVNPSDLNELLEWFKGRIEEMPSSAVDPEKAALAALEIFHEPKHPKISEADRRSAHKQILEAGGEVKAEDIPAEIVEGLRQLKERKARTMDPTTLKPRSPTVEEIRNLVERKGYDPETWEKKPKVESESSRRKRMDKYKQQLNEYLNITSEVQTSDRAEIEKKIQTFFRTIKTRKEMPSYKVEIANGQVEFIIEPNFIGEHETKWVFPFLQVDDEVEPISNYGDNDSFGNTRKLTIGKRYTVEKVEQSFKGRAVRIRADDGKIEVFPEEYFRRPAFTKFDFIDELARL